MPHDRAHHTRRTPQAAKDAAAAEEQYLRESLAAILQTEVEELQLGLQKRAEEAATAALEIDDGTVREVGVIFETEEARRPRHTAPTSPPTSPPKPRIRTMHAPCTHHARTMRAPCAHRARTGGVPRQRDVHV